MISKQSQIFVSTNNYEYKNLPVSKVKQNIKKYFVLSMHTGFNQYDFVPTRNIIHSNETVQLVKLTVKNNVDIEYTLVCTPDQKLYTKNNGYIAASKLKTIDLLFDEQGRYCKLINREYLNNTEPHELFNLEVNYNNNFICNGIVVKGV